jgi:amino-acid N-acetyltransferase
MAVRADRRRRGVGRALVGALGAALAAEGVGEVYLLTTGSEAFFAELGFAPFERASVPTEVAASRQFTMACCARATCMRRALRG